MRTKLNSSSPRPTPEVPLNGINKLRKAFDGEAFLAKAGVGKTVVSLKKKDAAFSQGAPADAVFYIQKGKVQLTVVSKIGKEATLGILSEGEFFGEGGLAGQPVRMGSATAMTDCELLRIDKKEMMLALHREHTFSDLFVAYLLARNIRYEEDLVDQLFNSSEKRLARILLLLAHFGKEGVPETVIAKISQETLADMIGTTRSRVSFFMNRFRKLGFVHNFPWPGIWSVLNSSEFPNPAGLLDPMGPVNPIANRRLVGHQALCTFADIPNANGFIQRRYEATQPPLRYAGHGLEKRGELWLIFR